MGMAYLGMSSAQGAPLLTDSDVAKGESFFLEWSNERKLCMKISSFRSGCSFGGSKALGNHRRIRYPLLNPHGCDVHWFRRSHCCGFHPHLWRLSSLYPAFQTRTQKWSMHNLCQIYPFPGLGRIGVVSMPQCNRMWRLFGKVVLSMETEVQLIWEQAFPFRRTRWSDPKPKDWSNLIMNVPSTKIIKNIRSNY